MSAESFDMSKLVTYEHSAAGHEGMLSDQNGDVVIKPCTAAEVAFYEETIRDHPEFATMMPAYMGQLRLSTAEERQALQQQDPMSINAALQAQEESAETLPLETNFTQATWGKKLDTELAMVFENIAAGYVKPNVLDVKLGSRLWSESALPAKRARLDKVSSETTSGSLGFRIAGMRVWESKPPEDGVSKSGDYKVYNKMYGRTFTPQSVHEGFRAFFFGVNQDTTQPGPERQQVLDRCTQLVSEMQQILEKEELRMYSSSILFAYEGDEQALKKAIQEEDEQIMVQEAKENAQKSREQAAETIQSDEDSEDELERPSVCDVRLIDFAHAGWTPGQGPDENSLQGVRSVRRILEELATIT